MCYATRALIAYIYLPIATLLGAQAGYGCAERDPYSAAPQALVLELDAGTSDSGAGSASVEGTMTLDPGERIFGDSAFSTNPALVMSWESPQKRTLTIGSGQGTPSYAPVRVTQLDAEEKVVFMTGGRPLIKIQDHPVGYLMHLSEVPHLWFGNTNREPVDLSYQGASLSGDAAGELFTIRGQSVSGTPAATSVRGGDLHLLAGDAASAYAIPLDPGEVLVRGGRVGGTTRGNIALHAEPDSYAGMEGGLYVHDAATLPTASPAEGGFLFADGGALYWHGSAGTVTQIAPP